MALIDGDDVNKLMEATGALSNADLDNLICFCEDARQARRDEGSWDE